MSRRDGLQAELLELVATLPEVDVQNRLMACTDRDIALALVGMSGEQAHAVVSHVSSRKAARVLEELALEERRRVDPKHVGYALNLLITSLRRNRTLSGRRSYIRPHRPRIG